MMRVVLTLSALFVVAENVESAGLSDMLVTKPVAEHAPLLDHLPAITRNLRRRPQSQRLACVFVMCCESENSRAIVEALLEAAHFVKIPGFGRGVQRLLARPAADDALDLIAAQLDNANGGIRNAAVASLIARGDEAAARALVQALGAADCPARPQILAALPPEQAGQLAPTLIELLDNAELSEAAAAALERASCRRLGRDAAKWRQWWQENKGRPRADWLVAALSDGSRAEADAAAGELHRLGDAYAYVALLRRFCKAADRDGVAAVLQRVTKASYDEVLRPVRQRYCYDKTIADWLSRLSAKAQRLHVANDRIVDSVCQVLQRTPNMGNDRELSRLIQRVADLGRSAARRDLSARANSIGGHPMWIKGSRQRRYVEAYEDGQEALALYSAIGQSGGGRRHTLYFIGQLHRSCGDFKGARPWLAESLRISLDANDHHRIGGCLIELAMAYNWAGELKESIPFYERAFAFRFPQYVQMFYGLARAYAQTGEPDLAIERLREAVVAGMRLRLETIQKDPQFSAIKGDPRLREIFGKGKPAR